MGLEFRKKSKLKGIECGYYFKGELLSRYKTEAILILRKRVEEAGKGNFLKGKEFLPDEWQVIHNEWEKAEERTNKTNIKKKPYWDKLHINSLKHKLLTLDNKIELQKSRKSQIEQIFTDRINALEKEKEEIMIVIKGEN
jgi:hypothetical protein